MKKKYHLYELTTHFITSHIVCSTITRHVNIGWFVVSAAGPDIGVVVVSTPLEPSIYRLRNAVTRKDVSLNV